MKREIILLCILFSTVYTSIYAQYPKKDGFKPQNFVEKIDSNDIIAERLCRIDTAFQRAVDQGILPQAVTLVIHKGNIIHYKAYGWRNIEKKIKCEKDDIFRIASQTKAISVCALMTLWEQGLFRLDDPIKKYIPAFENMQVLDNFDVTTRKYTTRPAKRDITIRDLMTHTSGICYNGVHWDIAIDSGVPPLNSLENITLEEVVNRIAKLPLAHDPGEKFTYSMNIEVLGRLAEILSGKPIDKFLKETIFDPLGMTDTYFYLPKEKKNRLVTLYTYPEGGPLQKSNHPIYQSFPIAGAKTYCSTGAGLSGTAIDYAKFCQMVMNGGEFNNHRILGRKTIEMMMRNNVHDLRGEIGFGLAWDVFRPQYVYKTIVSEGASRWGGMFGTDYIIDPAEDLIVIMYTNFEVNGTGVNFKEMLHNTTYQTLK